MSYSSVLNATLAFKAPGNVAVNAALAATAPYNAMVTGTIDIPAATLSAVSFPMTFGSIASPTALAVSNSNIYEMSIYPQGLSGGQFHIAPGGVLILAQPLSCNSLPMSACSVVTTTTQVSAGSVDYWVWGD